MNPAVPIRPYANTPGSSVAAGGAQDTREQTAEKLAPFCCLLKHHTADQFLDLMAENPDWKTQLRGFMLGRKVEALNMDNGLGMWLLSKREPAAFLACLDMVGAKLINIRTKASAETFLEAVQSGKPVIGLAIKVTFGTDADFNAEVVDLLAAAFRLNNGLDDLSIRFLKGCSGSVAPLADALAGIKDLRLELDFQFPVAPKTLEALARLFSANHQIESFNLRHYYFLGAGPTPEYIAAMNSFLETVKQQTRLASLTIHGVPQTGQQALGEFLAGSQTIAGLHISLHGDTFTDFLFAGLATNTTLRFLRLNVGSIVDPMLPVIDLLAGKKCGVTSFVLETRCGRTDMEDMRFIADMLASNDTISHFHWQLRYPQFIDLGALGAALEKNTTLVSIIVDRSETDARDEDQDAVEMVVNDQIPAFVQHLSANRTLTEFIFYPGNGSFGNKRLANPAIEGVLVRNRLYRDQACSRGFVTSATCGLFQVLNLPSEIGSVAAAHLLKHRPWIKAGAVALVNRATYRCALEKRREESAAMVENAFVNQSPDYAAARVSLLLKTIALMRQDFSDALIRRIPEHPYMASALIGIGQHSPQEYARLIVLLGEVVGLDKINGLISLEHERRKKIVAKPTF